MKLLAMENRQFLSYYLSRYQQVETHGAEVYVLNGVGDEDFWPAPRYRVVGAGAIDDIVAAAREWHAVEHFDGVLTFSESAVTGVAAVAEALGLPGIGVEAARRSRNKLLMRQAHLAGGAPCPSFRFVPELSDALAAAEDFGYPVILKPTMGAASNFVFRVDGPQEMVQRYEQASAGLDTLVWAQNEADGLDPGPQGLLVESFLDGSEHLIEALVWDDEVYLGSIVDRVTVEGGTFDDDVHHAPTVLGAEQIAAVHAAVTAGIRSQGVRRSAMHAEVRFHHGEPHVLEIAARVGGGGLDTIAKITADYDPIAAVIDVARGVHPKVRHFRPTGVHIGAMCLLCDAGVVDHVDVPASVSDAPNVFLLKITARPGDLIRRPPDGNSILGFLGATGDSMDAAMSSMNDLAKEITVTYRP